MGAKDILVYRSRETMTARQFIEIWLEDEVDDDPQDVAGVLADVVGSDPDCVYLDGHPPSLDVWDEDAHKERRDLQRDAVSALQAMVSGQAGIEAAPVTPLSRDQLVKAFEALNLTGPRFLYPPDQPGISQLAFDRSRPSPVPSTPTKRGNSGSECRHSEDYRTVVWYGETFHFSGRQAKAIEALWAEWEKGGLGLSQQTLGYIIDSASDRFQLRDVFRNHPAWGRMIHPAGGKGIFRLASPPE